MPGAAKEQQARRVALVQNQRCRGVSRFVSVEELFTSRYFDGEIVVLCVRWYLSFKLSYRDLVSMMTERGIGLAHTTILRWAQHGSGANWELRRFRPRSLCRSRD
jgi:hypothetical protein